MLFAVKPNIVAGTFRTWHELHQELSIPLAVSRPGSMPARIFQVPASPDSIVDRVASGEQGQSEPDRNHSAGLQGVQSLRRVRCTTAVELPGGADDLGAQGSDQFAGITVAAARGRTAAAPWVGRYGRQGGTRPGPGSRCCARCPSRQRGCRRHAPRRWNARRSASPRSLSAVLPMVRVHRAAKCTAWMWSPWRWCAHARWVSSMQGSGRWSSSGLASSCNSYSRAACGRKSAPAAQFFQALITDASTVCRVTLIPCTFAAMTSRVNALMWPVSSHRRKSNGPVCDGHQWLHGLQA